MIELCDKLKIMIGIVDYDIGNLRSVQKAFQHVGGEAVFVRTPEEIARVDALVLPDGEAAAATLLGDGQAGEFIQNQFRHGKTILAVGAGRSLLAQAGIDGGKHDPGLLLAEPVSIDIEGCIRAVARHRHPEREQHPRRL